MKKVYTLGHTEDDIDFVLIEGHLTTEEFKAALVADGWAEDYELHDLRQEWWQHVVCGDYWRKSEEGQPDAEPVTVEYW